MTSRPQSSEPPAGLADATWPPRVALDAVLAERLARAGVLAEGEVAVAVAAGVHAVAVADIARAAVERFEQSVAATDAGSMLARAARSDLRTPVPAFVLFFARPGVGDERARLLGVAMAAGALAAETRRGFTARLISGATLASAALSEQLAEACGPWFADAELVALVALEPAVVRGGVFSAGRVTVPPPVPVCWLGSAQRLSAPPAPSVERSLHPARIAVCAPAAAAQQLIAALAAAGAEIEQCAVAALRAVGPPDVVVASIDEPEERAALATLRAWPEARRVPWIAVSRSGHDDARLLASRAGAAGLLRLPSAPAEIVARVAAQLDARRALESARHDADEVCRAQGELVHAERMATLGWLAASVGHDLRAPLGAIRSNSELALRTLERMEAGVSSAPRALAALAELERTNLCAAERLGEIVAGLKAYARPGDSSAPPAAVTEVLDQVLALCARELTHARVVCRVATGLAPAAMPHAELMQVVMNLLLNAARAVGPGGTIELRAEPDGDRSALALTVADDGPGLAPEVRAKLFRPGFTTRAASGGTGLGLSIVKRLVDGHGGRIEVESELGRGARFRVIVPAAIQGGA